MSTDADRSTLGPYLAIVARIAGNPEATSDAQPVRIQFRSRSISVDLWEQDQIRLFRNQDGATPPGCSKIVAEAVALHCKWLSDTARLEAAPGADERSAAQADIERNARIARSLRRDVESTIETAQRWDKADLVGRLRTLEKRLDAIAPAPGVPGNHAALVGPTARVKPSAAPKSVGQAKPAEIPAGVDVVDHVLENLRERVSQVSDPLLTSTADEQPIEESLGIPRRRSAWPRRVAMTLALIAGAGLWSTLRGSLDVPTAIEVPAEVSALSDAPAVSAVELRPPALFVTVETARWDGLEPAERWELAERVADVASSAGLAGAHMGTADGRGVGRWLRMRGAELPGTAPVP